MVCPDGELEVAGDDDLEAVSNVELNELSAASGNELPFLKRESVSRPTMTRSATFASFGRTSTSTASRAPLLPITTEDDKDPSIASSGRPLLLKQGVAQHVLQMGQECSGASFRLHVAGCRPCAAGSHAAGGTAAARPDAAAPPAQPVLRHCQHWSQGIRSTARSQDQPRPVSSLPAGVLV